MHMATYLSTWSVQRGTNTAGAALITPYVFAEEGPPRYFHHFDQSWDSHDNREALRTGSDVPRLLHRCPLDPCPTGPPLFTSYLMLVRPPVDGFGDGCNESVLAGEPTPCWSLSQSIVAFSSANRATFLGGPLERRFPVWQGEAQLAPSHVVQRDSRRWHGNRHPQRHHEGRPSEVAGWDGDESRTEANNHNWLRMRASWPPTIWTAIRPKKIGDEGPQRGGTKKIGDEGPQRDARGAGSAEG